MDSYRFNLVKPKIILLLKIQKENISVTVLKIREKILIIL